MIQRQISHSFCHIRTSGVDINGIKVDIDLVGEKVFGRKEKGNGDKERQILCIFFNMQNLVIKKLLEGLERWLSCYEYLLLLQRTWVPFPAPAQWLTTTYTSSYKVLGSIPSATRQHSKSNPQPGLQETLSQERKKLGKKEKS